MTPSLPPGPRSKVLFTLALTLAGTIPVSVSQIPDPVIRTLVATAIVLIVFWIMWRMPPPPSEKETFDITVPDAPRAKGLTTEPITIPDRPLRSLRIA